MSLKEFRAAQREADAALRRRDAAAVEWRELSEKVRREYESLTDEEKAKARG